MILPFGYLGILHETLREVSDCFDIVMSTGSLGSDKEGGDRNIMIVTLYQFQAYF